MSAKTTTKGRTFSGIISKEIKGKREGKTVNNNKNQPNNSGNNENKMEALNEDSFVAILRQDFPEMKVSKQDLLNPTKQFAVTYYSHLVEQIMHIKLSEMCRPNEGQLEKFENAEAFGQGALHYFITHNLYKTLKYIFEQIGYTTEFRYTDLTRPYKSPQRTFTFMKSLYQLYYHCVAFDEEFDEVERNEDRTQIVNDLQYEIDMLAKKVAEKNARKEEVHRRTEDIKKHVLELSEENEKTDLTLKELQQIKDSHSEQMRDLEGKERALQEDFARADNEKKFHESLVVPDLGIIDKQGELSRKKDEIILKLRELEQHVAEKTAKVIQFGEVLGHYNSLVETLHGEITLGGKNLDIRGIYMELTGLKKQIEEKEEKELVNQFHAKEQMRSLNVKETERLIEELEAKKLTLGKDTARLSAKKIELQKMLSEFLRKSQIDEATFRHATNLSKELDSQVAAIIEKLVAVDADYCAKYKRIQDEMVQFLREIRAGAEKYMVS